ncbi:MAG: sarcosine oxidase subunit gamma [Methylotenera sp.]
MSVLEISDMSTLERFGVKGTQAAKWLAGHDVSIPEYANTWILNNGETLVMRLGSSEFLIEDQVEGQMCKKLATDKVRIAGVYIVPHADASYLLAGSEVLNLLSEVCSLDLRESALQDNELVMTQVAGVSATVLRQQLNNETVYRLWCDGTYAKYMQHVLDEIAQELKGLIKLG